MIKFYIIKKRYLLFLQYFIVGTISKENDFMALDINNKDVTTTDSDKSPIADFEIHDGVLIKYLGSGGDVVIPDSVTAIMGKAFYGCNSLTSIVIPNSITSIGENAFYSCRELASVVIPDTVTSIEKGAFCGCSSLTSIVIPNSVTVLKIFVFKKCSALTNIVIPDSVTTIENGAFFECNNLTDDIKEKILSINTKAFSIF